MATPHYSHRLIQRSMEAYRYLDTRDVSGRERKLKYDSPSVTELMNAPVGGPTKIVFTQVMPLTPTSQEHYTASGVNPFHVPLSLWQRLCCYRAHEPFEVELCHYRVEDTMAAMPVLDLSGGIVAIPHGRVRQYYKVVVNRPQGSLTATVILRPIFTPLHMRMSSIPCAYDLHYRRSDFYLADGTLFHAIGREVKGEKLVSVQVEPFVHTDMKYSDFIGIELRNGKKFSVTSVEHNMTLLKCKEPKFEAPFVASAIMARIRIKDFPADGTSILEAGDGDACILKPDMDAGLDSNSLRDGNKLIPALCKNETGVLKPTTAAVVDAENVRVAPYLNDKQPPLWIREMVPDYLKLIMPDKHIGVPISIEEADADSRPKQQSAFNNVANDVIDREPQPTKMFMKQESTGPDAAGRLISNPDDHLRVLSKCFGTPLTDYLKKGKFGQSYGFVEPEVLKAKFERVVRQMIIDTFGAETDFSKMDSSVNEFMRWLESVAGLWFFHPDYHQQWLELHEKLYAAGCSKKLHGHVVKLGVSRRSGEYFTSTFNTLLNHFYIVCCYMNQGMTLEEAVEKVGLVGGDDGLHSGLDKEVAERTAKDLGFVVKVDIVHHTDPVSFLGLVRLKEGIYTYDPVRFVKKCSSSIASGSVPPEERAYRKFEPYVRMYGNVPLIGNLSRAVIRILVANGFKGPDKKFDELCRGMVGFIHTRFHEVGLINDNDAYDVLRDGIAQRLGISPVTLDILCEAYDNAKSFSDFPSHVLTFGDYKAFTVPTIFQGDLFVPPEVPQEESVSIVSANTHKTKRLNNNDGEKKKKIRRRSRSTCKQEGSDTGSDSTCPSPPTSTTSQETQEQGQ